MRKGLAWILGSTVSVGAQTTATVPITLTINGVSVTVPIVLTLSGTAAAQIGNSGLCGTNNPCGITSGPVNGAPVTTTPVTPITPPPVTTPVNPPTNTQGWTGPQTAPMSAMTMGQNGYMNGFLPFCPSPTHCSVIYKDISAEPVATQDNTYFQNNYAGSGWGANFQEAGATLPYFNLDVSDSSLTYQAFHSTDIPTESDDTVIPLKCGQMYTEGGGDPCQTWMGDGRDRHLSVNVRNLTAGTIFAHELYNPETKNGTGDTYSNTIWNLLQPIEEQGTGGYTSADAAGLPQLSLDVTYEDLAAGEIKHALRFTVPRSSIGFYAQDRYQLYTLPAVHGAGTGGGDRVAYMGEWVRLKSTTPTPAACGPQGKVEVAALRKHGAIVADNGRFGQIQGIYDTRIDQNDVGCISAFTGADFEVIKPQLGPVVAGELNPEDMTLGVSQAYDQTGLYSTTNNPGKSSPLTTATPAAPTASCTASASTVALGSSVTFTITGTNIVKGWIDNAYGVVTGATGGTITYAPTQSSSYTAKVRGLNGYAYASCGTVNVTGPTVATPTFTPAAGQYTSAQIVSIAETTSGATTHYTTDGTTPSVGSPTYTAPFTISTPTLVQAQAYASGMLNSAVASARYLVNIPGAVPSVLGTLNSGGLSDGTTRTLTYNFAGGTSAVLGMMWTNSGNPLPSSVTCGGVNAGLIGPQSTSVNGAPNFTVAAYFIQSAPTGATTCTVTWPSTVYATVSLAEISGASGLDSTYGSNNTVTTVQLPCGSVTTAGPNRLVLAAGEMIYSNLTAPSGYKLVYPGYNAMMSTTQATAGTVSPVFNSNNGNPGSCVSFALKP